MENDYKLYIIQSVLCESIHHYTTPHDNDYTYDTYEPITLQYLCIIQ